MNKIIIICILFACHKSFSDVRVGLSLSKVEHVSINASSAIEGPEDQRNPFTLEVSLFKKDENLSAIFKYASTSYFDKNRTKNIDDSRMFFGMSFSLHITDKVIFEPIAGLAFGDLKLISPSFQSVERESYISAEFAAKIRIYLFDEMGMSAGYGSVLPIDKVYRMNYFEAGIFRDF